MTTLVFGNFPADMTEPGEFGYGRFFPRPDVEWLATRVSGDPLLEAGSMDTGAGEHDRNRSDGS